MNTQKLVVIEPENVLENNSLAKIMGGLDSELVDCSCGSANNNKSGGDCTCGSGNTNNTEAYSLSFD